MYRRNEREPLGKSPDIDASLLPVHWSTIGLIVTGVLSIHAFLIALTETRPERMLDAKIIVAVVIASFFAMIFFQARFRMRQRALVRRLTNEARVEAEEAHARIASDVRVALEDSSDGEASDELRARVNGPR